jgi:ribosomal protein L29
MSRIAIGNDKSAAVHLDVDVLLRTRMLIQANSGGGKSWTLRRLAEQLFGKVQVVIVDPEGEFSTLREKYDYVLVGKGGETPADCRSAALVAHKLLELRASAVCDLYEMKAHERHRWVRLFLEAMIDAPKNLWHPVVIIVDEAHSFCPEKGAGESEASDAMIGLATRGRKRGFAAIYATQRLGKLRKDAAAELLNVMVGPTFIDIDRKRAAEALGINRGPDEKAFFANVKTMKPGSFYSLGRAISTSVIQLQVGKVLTSHPEPGSSRFAAKAPPPPSKVKALLPKLADLPQEAETKARTDAELRSEIRKLKAELAASRAAKPVIQAQAVPATKKIRVPILTSGQAERLVRFAQSAEKVAAKIEKASREVAEAVQRSALLSKEAQKQQPSVPVVRNPVILRPRPPLIWTKPPRPQPLDEENGRNLRGGERRMLQVLAQRNPLKLTRCQLGTLSGFTPSGGTFLQYFGNLRKRGLLEENRNDVTITEAGLAHLGTDIPEAPRTPEEIQQMWRSRLRGGEAKMLDFLIRVYPSSVTREKLGEAIGFTHTGGTFLQYLGTLRRNGLAECSGPDVAASDTLFTEVE